MKKHQNGADTGMNQRDQIVLRVDEGETGGGRKGTEHRGRPDTEGGTRAGGQ